MKRQKVLMAFLILFALLNTAKWGLHMSGADYHPLDFRTYYTGAAVYWQDRNPYNDFQNEIQWAKSSGRGSDWQGNLGFPHATVVYAPQFVWYFLAYTLFDFRTAQWLQFALNLLSIAGIVWLIPALNRKIKPLTAMLAVLAFRGTWYALDNGQPMLQVLFVCLLALYHLKEKQGTILSGILFGLVAFKFTLLLPFLLFLLLEKQYKTLLICIFTAALLNLTALALHPEGLQLLSEWQSNMQRMWAYPHQSGHLNALAVISTAISVPLAYAGLSLSVLKPLMALLLAFSYVILLMGTKEKPGWLLLSPAMLAGLCFGQHLVYDCLALLVFRLLIQNEDLKLSLTETLVWILLIIPLGSIAGKTGLPELNFLLPIALLVFFIKQMNVYLFRKYNPAKKAS